MWIIFFQDAPHFWLVGGESYRVGKKDCHVVIQDDRSISRIHLTITVGLSQPQDGDASASGVPQRITLLDSSTYGTSITAEGGEDEEEKDGDTHDSPLAAARGPSATASAGPHAPAAMAALDTGIVGLRYASAAIARARSASATHRSDSDRPPTARPLLRLAKGVPHEVPTHRPSWRQFTVQLGHHGAQLRLAWVDVSVLCEDVEVEMQTKLEHALRACGVRQQAVPSDAVPSASATPAEAVSGLAPLPGSRNTLSQRSLGEELAHANAGRVAARPPPAVLGGSGVLSLSQRSSVSGTPTAPALLSLAAPSQGQPSSCAAAALTAATRLCYSSVDFLVTSAVQPSTAVVGMLCRAVPIVTPAFFTAIRDRASPQIPLPDPRHYAPPLSPWWCDVVAHARQLLPVDSEAAASPHTAESARTASSTAVVSASASPAPGALTTRQMLDYFQPNPQRCVLFQGTTFVVVQRHLYDEVTTYLDSTGATVVWEEGLEGWVGQGGERESLVSLSAEGLQRLQRFFTQHQRHIVLYNETEDWPFAHCLEVLRHALGLCSVEYGTLIEAILMACPPPALPPFPDKSRLPQTVQEVEAAVRAGLGQESPSASAERDDSHTQDSEVDRATQDDETTEGRRTEAQPLFDEVAADGGGGRPSLSRKTVRGREGAEASPQHQRPRKESADGWVSFGRPATSSSVAAEGAAAVSRGGGGGSASAARTAEIHYSPYVLPPYPCFVDAPVAATSAAAEAADGATGERRKVFVKQRLPPAEPLVELAEHQARRQLAASMLVSRVPAVDADTVVAEQVVMGSVAHTIGATAMGLPQASDVAFNAFDTVVHNAANRRRGTAARRGGRGGGARGGGRRQSNSPPPPVSTATRRATASAGVVDVDEGDDGMADAGQGESAMNNTFHIFDIDGIF